MRVTQSLLYRNFISNMNSSLTELMDLNIQSSSQKKINRPSDDPVGMARVLDYRKNLGEIAQYRDNVSMAEGWLGLADQTLLEVSDIVIRARGLAEQAATGTYGASNREQISYEVRQLFQQLVGLANTDYNGKSIFAGHKVTDNAYEESLMLTSTTGDVNPYIADIRGDSDTSVLVQFVGAGTAITGQDNIDYRFSKDGGDTWSGVKTLAGSGAPGPPSVTLDLDGVEVDLRSGYEVELSDPDAEPLKTSEGTWMKVVPTAVYKGDEENNSATEIAVDPSNAMEVLTSGGFERDVRIQVTAVGPPAGRIFYDYTSGGQTYSFSSDSKVLNLPEGQIELKGDVQAGLDFTVRSGSVPVNQAGSDVNAWGDGSFPKDVMVRLDNSTTLGSGTPIEYSYSTDGGKNWKSGNTVPNPAGGPARLVVAGGVLNLTAKPGPTGSDLAAGDQFFIHPEVAAINVAISSTEDVQINNIGKDIFGGFYSQGTAPVFEDTPKKNLFLAMGKLVGALETNDQDEVQEALEELEKSQNVVMNGAASVGGRENRLVIAETVLSGLKLNEEEGLSRVEDVDVTALMTRIAQQEVAYTAVLKSSSTIMKMSLMSYI